MNNSCPLSGRLLTGSEAYRWLKGNLYSNNGLVGISSICSAYIKRPVIDELVQSPVEKCRVLVRFKKSDILSGASDLDIYRALANKGWKLYLNTQFHGKVYHLPGAGVLVGSSNATVSGFSLYGSGNIELSTLIEESDDSLSVVNQLFDSSVLMTDSLYKMFESDLNSSMTMDEGVDSEWGFDLSSYLPKSVSMVLVSDMFQSNPTEHHCNEESLTADLSLLGLNSFCSDFQTYRAALLGTKAFAWLRDSLSEKDELYFGELSAKLHSSLIDSPTPYRSTVKLLLSNLLGWISIYANDHFRIDRPNHSQRIKLIK